MNEITDLTFVVVMFGIFMYPVILLAIGMWETTLDNEDVTTTSGLDTEYVKRILERDANAAIEKSRHIYR